MSAAFELGEAVRAICGGDAETWQRLIDDAGGLATVADGRAEYLAREAGCTLTQARRFGALVHLTRHATATPIPVGAAFTNSASVYGHFKPLSVEKVETFWALLLDQRHRLLKVVEVSRGSLSASIVHPRDVFRPVILEGAAAVVFVHNHPSGDPVPSGEDLEITRRLREVGDLLGVRVLDHVIIGAGRFVSFVDDGYW